MKNSKKILCLLLSALMVFSMAACGGKQKETDADGTTAAASDETKADPGSADKTYDYSAGLTEDGKFDGVNAPDYVTLPEYIGMDIPYETHTLAEEELQSAIDEVLAEGAETVQIKDRAVVDRDTVNIDYVGKVDGVAFDGGNTNGNGTTVTIGVTSYIDDFLEQLIGHKPGETFDINVTFPDPYTNNTDLSGKDAVFTTTINYIEEPVLPELTDDWIKENLGEFYQSAAEFREALSKNLLREKEVSYIQNFLFDNTEVKEVPKAIVKYQENYVVSYYSNYAASNGTDLVTLLASSGMTVDNLIEQYRNSIDNAARQELILQAAVAKEQLTVTEDDLKAFFLENTGSEDYSSYLDSYGKGYTCKLVSYSVLIDHILENAKLLEQ